MIVAVSMMRDEADVAAAVVRHLYNEGVDLVIVADNLSTDGTGELARDAGAQVILDPEPGYYQADKMTDLARRAHELGATWVLPFDADEIFYSPTGPISDALDTCPADVIVCHGWDHIACPRDRFDQLGVSPFERIVHRRPTTQPLPKVAFRARSDITVRQGNHSVEHIDGMTYATGILEYRHFQYRSLEQMTRKVRQGAHAYDLTPLPETEGAHWRGLARLTDVEIASAWTDLQHTPDLVLDPAPTR